MQELVTLTDPMEQDTEMLATAKVLRDYGRLIARTEALFDAR